MNLTKEGLKEMLILVAVMTIFAILGLVSMPYMLILIPAPFIVFNIKNNIFLGNLSFVIISLAISVTLGLSVGIIFLILLLPIINIMSFLFKKREKSSNVILYGTIALFISFLMILALANTGEESIGKVLETDIQVMVDSQLDIIKESDLDLEALQIDQLKESVKDVAKRIVYILPSIIFITSFIVSYINYKIVAMSMDRLDVDVIENKSLKDYKLPNNFIFGIILVSLLTLLLGSANLVNSEIIYSNIIFLSSVFILLQGIAVIDYFLVAKKIFFVVRILLISIIFFIPTLMSVAYILGVMDYIFNLRKLKN